MISRSRHSSGSSRVTVNEKTIQGLFSIRSATDGSYWLLVAKISLAETLKTR
jgi:hypothetical protein